MTTTTLTLAAFLEARPVEDEAETRRGDGQDFVPTGYWDNTRVLAEVAAKRRLVELWSQWDALCSPDDWPEGAT